MSAVVAKPASAGENQSYIKLRHQLDGNDPKELFDAYISGPDSAEWQALLAREMTFLLGRDKNKDARQGNWDNKSATFAQWLIGGKDGALARFKLRSKKGYNPAVFGKASGTTRGAETMRSVEALWFDFDYGDTSYNDALERASALGCCVITYTSFSDGKTVTSLPRGEVLTHFNIERDPTEEEVRKYLRCKDKLAPAIVETVRIIDQIYEDPDKGLQIRVEHDPVEKFRMIFPLADAVDLRALHAIPARAKDIYRAKVRGLAEKLGVRVDDCCTRLAQVCYLPSRAKGTDAAMDIVRGRGLAWDEVPTAAGDPFERASKGAEDAGTIAGLPAKTWARKYGHRIRMRELVEHEAPDMIRQGGICCPFDHEHSNAGDPDDSGGWVKDPDGAGGGFGWGCLHSCRERYDRLGYVREAVRQGWFDEALLIDDDYMEPLCDEEVEAEEVALVREVLRKMIVRTREGETLPADAGQQAIAHLIESGVDEAEAEERVSVAIADVQRQLEERATDREADPVAEEKVAGKVKPEASVMAPLYDEAAVALSGFVVTPDAAPEVYKKYSIKTTDEDAVSKLASLLKDQTLNALTRRFSYVVVDGDAKLAIHAAPGEPVRLWKESTLSKLYLNRAVAWEVEGADKPKSFKPADVFLYARQRETFIDTCFEPDPVKAADKCNAGKYNLWTGFAIEPVPGSWERLKDHIRSNICNNDELTFNWVITWLASLFQRPGVKIPSAIAIIGEQGTGKSKVFDWVRRGIGAAALKISNGKHLTGSFNAHLDGKIFLTCEEAFWGGEKAAAGTLKDLITSDTIPIEGKFANVVERPNYINTVFVSNNEWVIPTDGEDARRFLVLRCGSAQKQNAAYFGAIDDEMESGGLAAMVHEFMRWNPADVGLKWGSLRNPPVTDELRKQAGLGLSGPMARLADAVENGVLEGRSADGSAFFYELNEDQPTRIARQHLVAALQPETARANLSGEMRKLVDKYLVDGGDNKAVVNYLGSILAGDDSRPNLRTERARYVDIPALVEMRERLRQVGRG